MPGWPDSALILVGHGSSRNPGSRVPTCRLAEELARRQLFAEVRACFLKEPPDPRQTLDRVSAKRVYVVPNFAGSGHFTQAIIPAELGLIGPVTVAAGRTILYAEPVGGHPRVIAMIRRQALAALAENGRPPGEVCLLLVGHGSTRPGGAAATAEAIAAVLRGGGEFGEVATAFLEEAPFVADWRRIVGTRAVVVVPLLIAEGLHASEDLAPLFGLAPGAPGPAIIDNREVWLGRGIGSDPEVVEIILDLVRACDIHHPR